MIGNEVMIMPAKLPGGALAAVRLVAGLPASSARSCSRTSRPSSIKDVVFVTGDIHTFIAGDVRTAGRPGRAGRAWSSSAGRSPRAASARATVGGGIVLPGNDAQPAHSPGAHRRCCAASNPWVDQADFDHHGYARVTATQKRFDCEFVRDGDDQAPLAGEAPVDGFRYSVARGQTSIKGVNGPPRRRRPVRGAPARAAGSMRASAL